MATLGAAIRSLRTHVGLSQEGLAQLVGSSQAEISRMERDRSQLIRPELLVRLASVLGVSPTALLPETDRWRVPPTEKGSPAGGFHVGFWESVWTAPLIPVALEALPSLRLSSRLGLCQDLRASLGRPMTPGELVRALEHEDFAAIVVPREVLFENPDRFTECAQIAAAIDGVRVAVCTTREDAEADGLDGRAAWERVRRASLIEPVRVYFPMGTGAVETVRRLGDVLDRRVELLGVAPEQWPALWDGTNDNGTAGGHPVLAVAAEPHLDAWRRSVWESNRGLTTVPLHSRELWPDAPPTVTVLSLIFNNERAPEWLNRSIVYEFLGAAERRAEDIRGRAPRALAAIAQRLQLDVPTVVRECARCDFTTRFAPSWVAKLREQPVALSAKARSS